jgi:hypothetical protein
MLALMVGTFFVTTFWPWNPITRLNITVVGSPMAGRSLTVNIDYCKARAWAPAEVRWMLVNDVSIVLPVQTASMPPGCHIKPLLLPLPRHILPGEYRLQEELIYEPWPWKQYVYVVQSPTFTVQAGAVQ